MKNIVLVSLLLIALQAIADNPTDTTGTNSRGEKITIYKEWVSDGYREDISVEHDGKTKVYKNQPCERTGTGYPPKSFHCPKEGFSPLAGATYEYKGTLSNCGGILYICESGCGAHAPKKMIKEIDECE